MKMGACPLWICPYIFSPWEYLVFIPIFDLLRKKCNLRQRSYPIVIVVPEGFLSKYAWCYTMALK